MTTAFVRSADAPLLTPPRLTTGPVAWVLHNLFPGVLSSIVTLLLLSLIGVILWSIIPWALINAVWSGADREACVAQSDGACWPFVVAKVRQWIYGFYPIAERWRVTICFAVLAIALVPMMMPSAPYKLWNTLFLLVAFPIMTFVLVRGGVFGLVPVGTLNWGGLLVTLIVSMIGIVASLPLGILLALGRQSDLPIVRYLCTGFIEVVRGVPLITVLFMAKFMFPLFMPPGVNFDDLLKALIGVALFSSAYMAEVVRGGLQAIPKGQVEASKALGLSYWKTMFLIVLPQALKIVIPGIVNTFIGLFKDTTLVSTISIFDLLGVVQSSFNDAKWASPQTGNTGYFVLALIYWVFCFSMSRYSIYTERRLNTGHKR